MSFPHQVSGEPDASKVIEVIQAAISNEFSIQIGQQHDSYLSFKIGESPFISLRVTAERKKLGAADWIDGDFNWNSRWKIEMDMVAMPDRFKTWRPNDEKLAEILPKILAVISDWIA